MQHTTPSTIAITNIEPLEGRVVPATLFAVTDTNHLIHFESTTPNVMDGDVEITGLQSGEIIAGIDFRPATGELYALGIVDPAGANNTQGRIYKLDLTTGAATQVGNAPFSTTLSDFVNQGYGFDFNPVADKIRITNLSTQNLRVNPDDGTIFATDTALNETSAGAELVSGAAYTNNYAGATETTLFGVDWLKDKLVRIGGDKGDPSPNGGVVTVFGSLGLSFATQTGFDIGADGIAYLGGTASGSTSLFTVNLLSGAATKAGDLGWVGNLRGLSVFVPQATVSPDGKSASYTDVDGDVVTVKTTKGQFNDIDLVLISAGGLGRGVLSQLNLSDDAAEFEGANLTFTVKKSATGDGLADIGWINSTGHDLGKVVVKGDLGRITAGDGDDTLPGLAKLTVGSLGVNDDITLPPENKFSRIDGAVGQLVIAGNQESLFTTVGNIASAKIGGDFTGRIECNGKLATLTIGGSVDGSDGSGIILALELGAVKIGRDLVGDEGFGSGRILSYGPIKSVAVGGSVIGGDGQATGVISAAGKIGTVKIAGDLRGGTGENGGIFLGGSTLISGAITGQSIGSVSIGGSVLAEEAATFMSSGAILSETTIGSVAVKGSLVGTEQTPVQIIAKGLGTSLPAGASSDVAIGKIAVKGRVERADIMAGYRLDFDTTAFLDSTFGLFAENSNAGIGSVTVGKDWIASNLVAGARNLGADDMANGLGANADNVNYGDAHDALIPTPGADSIVARIASVSIKGRVLGTAASGDHYGFVAEQIGKFSALGVKPALTTGKDGLIALAPLTGDVKIHEV